MPVREYFLDEVAAARRTVYRKYMHDVAVMLGADAETAERDVEEMMLFEIELAKVRHRNREIELAKVRDRNREIEEERKRETWRR